MFDQGQLGSCVWNAVAGMIADNQPSDELLSRLWGYWKTRVYERTTHEDAGCTARGALKTLAKSGCAPESDWPYDVAKAFVQPNRKSYVDAKHQVVDSYERIPPGLDAMLDALAMGKDFIIGLALFGSFDSDQVARDGMVPMPSHGEGGPYYHEVRCVGYHSRGRVLICRNSWGNQWGDDGDFYLPFDYANSPDLVIDVWTVTLSHRRS